MPPGAAQDGDVPAQARKSGGSPVISIAGVAFAAVAGWAWSRHAQAAREGERATSRPGENTAANDPAGEGEDEQDIAGAGDMVHAEAAPCEEEANEPKTPTAGWGSSWGGAGGNAVAVEKSGGGETGGEEAPSRWRALAASWGSAALAVGDYVYEPFYKQWIVNQIQNGAPPRARGAAAALDAGRGGLLRAVSAGRGNPAWAQAAGRGAPGEEVRVDAGEAADAVVDVECIHFAHSIYHEGAECEAAMAREGYTVMHIQQKDTDHTLQHPKWAVVVSPARALVLVVYRGTWSWSDTIHDLMFIPMALPCGIKVNKGPSIAVSWSEASILSVVQRALHLCAEFAPAGAAMPKVVFTGHSYGGGCAMLLRLHSLVDPAWKEALIGVDIAAVTFGAPLVFGIPKQRLDGAAAGADGAAERGALMEAVHRSTRNYVHQGDIIPRLLGPHASALLAVVSAADAGADAPAGGRGRQAMHKVGKLVGGLAGSYGPVGSFRFLYARDGANGEEVMMRRVDAMGPDAAELDRILIPPKTAFIPYSIKDHSTLLYAAKLAAIRDRALNNSPSLERSTEP